MHRTEPENSILNPLMIIPLIIKLRKKKLTNFLKERIGDESDYNKIKQIQIQKKFIKEQLKDSLLKYDQLSEQVKELLKNVKIDIKIKPQISQICKF